MVDPSSFMNKWQSHILFDIVIFIRFQLWKVLMFYSIEKIMFAFRYFYIVKGDWLHSTFPKTYHITLIAFGFNIILFLLCELSLAGVVVYCGGPGHVTL